MRHLYIFIVPAFLLQEHIEGDNQESIVFEDACHVPQQLIISNQHPWAS